MRRGCASLVIALLAISSCTTQTKTEATLPPLINLPVTAATTSTTVFVPTTTTSVAVEPPTVPPTVPPTEAPTTSSSVYASWSDVVATEQSGVVRIRSTTCDKSGVASGSGFAVGPGLVVTAAHVVDGYGTFAIDRFVDDPERQPAVLIGIDVAEDVALLRIGDFDGYQFAFADALPVAGADVGLIGYSGGRIPARPIRGTVNQTGLPSGPYGDEGQYRPSHLIEHDLSSNKGDSGAPLLDPVTGRVVGINVASDVELQGIKYGVYPASAEVLIAQGAGAEPIDQCAPSSPPTTTTIVVPPSTTTIAVVPGDLYYSVLPGDTLYGIARAFNTTFAAIQALNDPALIAVIKPGQLIALPKSARPLTPADVATLSYTVQPGDTIIAIARANSTTPAELLALNGKLQTPNILKAGQVLLIPHRV